MATKKKVPAGPIQDMGGGMHKHMSNGMMMKNSEMDKAMGQKGASKKMMGVTGNAGSTDGMMGPTVVKIPKKKGKK